MTTPKCPCQTVFQSHSCQKYCMNTVSGLRNLTEKLESIIRNLKGLKVDPTSYDILLMPLINEKLQTEMSLVIARNFENKL